MKQLIIEGDQINDIASFYEEINRVFMPNEDWQMGESLDALSDLMYGGYGEIKGNEPVQIVWNNIKKAETVLGLQETIAFYTEKLQHPDTYNVKWINEKLDALQKGQGQTYFEIIIEIFNEHPNIQLLRN